MNLDAVHLVVTLLPSFADRHRKEVLLLRLRRSDKDNLSFERPVKKISIVRVVERVDLLVVFSFLDSGEILVVDHVLEPDSPECARGTVIINQKRGSVEAREGSSLIPEQAVT